MKVFIIMSSYPLSPKSINAAEIDLVYAKDFNPLSFELSNANILGFFTAIVISADF